MKLLIKNGAGQISKINCCDNFPTFAGDKFTMGIGPVTVIEVDSVRVIEKQEFKTVVKNETTEQMSLF